MNCQYGRYARHQWPARVCSQSAETFRAVARVRGNDDEVERTGSALSATFLAPPRAGQKRIRASTCLSLACEASCAAPVFCRARRVPDSRSEFGAIAGAGLLATFCPRKSSSPQQGAKPKPGCTAMRQHRRPLAGNRPTELCSAVLGVVIARAGQLSSPILGHDESGGHA